MTYVAILEGGNVNYLNLHSKNRLRLPNTYRHQSRFNLSSIFYVPSDVPVLKHLHPDIEIITKDEYYTGYKRYY
jgi:hypothetical protein